MPAKPGEIRWDEKLGKFIDEQFEYKFVRERFNLVLYQRPLGSAEVWKAFAFATLNEYPHYREEELLKAAKGGQPDSRGMRPDEPLAGKVVRPVGLRLAEGFVNWESKPPSRENGRSVAKAFEIYLVQQGVRAIIVVPRVERLFQYWQSLGYTPAKTQILSEARNIPHLYKVLRKEGEQLPQQQKQGSMPSTRPQRPTILQRLRKLSVRFRKFF